jgi:hypothetical protein
MKALVDKTFEFEDITIFLKIFKLHKNHLLLLSDHKEMGIGDVTLSSPSQIEGLKSTSSTYNLFGIHNSLLSSIVAKRAAALLKNPVLTLVCLQKEIQEQEIIKPLISFLNESLRKINENKNEVEKEKKNKDNPKN